MQLSAKKPSNQTRASNHSPPLQHNLFAFKIPRQLTHLTLVVAVYQKKLFFLDYHDPIAPLLLPVYQQDYSDCQY